MWRLVLLALSSAIPFVMSLRMRCLFMFLRDVRIARPSLLAMLVEAPARRLDLQGRGWRGSSFWSWWAKKHSVLLKSKLSQQAISGPQDSILGHYTLPILYFMRNRPQRKALPHNRIFQPGKGKHFGVQPLLHSSAAFSSAQRARKVYGCP